MKASFALGVLAVALGGSACGDSSDGDPATGTANPFGAAPAPAAANPMGATTPSPMTPSPMTPSPMASAPLATNPSPNPTAPSAMAPEAMAPEAMQPIPMAQAPAAAPAASFPGEACDGCARFFLPMNGENQRGDFELDLAAPIDMTGATLRFRLQANAFTGNAGGVSVFVRDAGNFDKGFVWTNLTALSTWTDVAVDFTAMLAGNMSFDVTQVAKVGVQLNSAGAFAGANWQNATVYLDSVRFSNAPAADLTFSDGIGDFALVGSGAPGGSNVGFIAP